MSNKIRVTEIKNNSKQLAHKINELNNKGLINMDDRDKLLSLLDTLMADIIPCQLDYIDYVNPSMLNSITYANIEIEWCKEIIDNINSQIEYWVTEGLINKIIYIALKNALRNIMGELGKTDSTTVKVLRGKN